MTTTSLIDHMVTNTPENISDSDVIHTGISDHSLIFAIRKISVIKKQENIVEMRNMKKNLLRNCSNSTGNKCIFLLKTQLICGRFGNKYS
jgi:hypothetical protein